MKKKKKQKQFYLLPSSLSSLPPSLPHEYKWQKLWASAHHRKKVSRAAEPRASPTSREVGEGEKAAGAPEALEYMMAAAF
jgi:hypothetical protein